MFWRQALLTYGTFDPTDSYYQNERSLFDYATHHYKVLAARGGGRESLPEIGQVW